MMSDLWRASRPFSWINTALPFLGMAWAVHRGLTLPIMLGTLYFLAPYNLLLYGVNDRFDYESDRRNPRKGGAIEGGLLPPARTGQLTFATLVTNLPFLAVLGGVGGWTVSLALVITVMVALAYSAPPLRTKEIAGLDSVTSSLHFVLPCVCGGLVAGASLTALPWRILMAFFLWGVASQALGAIQDVRYDREAGIGSVAVSLGARGAAALSTVAYAASVLILGSAGGAALVAAAALLPYVLLAGSCLSGDPEVQARRAWHGFLGMNLLTGFIITQVLLRVWGAGNITVLDLLSWGSAAGLFVLLLHTWANERSLRRTALPSSYRLPVSVIVPVLNEEGTIETCLRSVRAQSYDGSVEIVVVDDGSTDRTVQIAQRLLGGEHRLLQPGAAPVGWTGKCWAAQHGADVAHGEILIFLDADTVLEPDAVAALVDQSQSGGGLISILTRYRMDTRAERALIPAFVHMQLCFLPIAVMNRSRPPHLVPSFGYGPCMTVPADEYRAAGGHAAIRASDREDIDLARLMQRTGHRVRFLRGADLASTRHYRNVSEVMRAWRRTYYAYAGNSLALALFGMLGITGVFLLPFLLLPIALLMGDSSAAVGSIAGLAALVVLRLVVAVKERQPLTTILWHPVTWLASLTFQALSVWDGLRGLPPRWRGRSLPMETAQ